VWFTLLLALLSAPDEPFPEGRSDPTLEGLQVALHVPAEPGRDGKFSLVVLLHGAGDNGPNLIGAMAEWVPQGYLLCAPSARQATWTPADLAATRRIAAHVKRVMPIDPKRVHAVGFSNGGWNLAEVAFDDDLRPCSATWIAAGFNGGSVPKWAKKEMGALALAGSEDANAGAARQTVPALQEKVRSVEARFQKGLDHKWPRELMPYFLWWMGAMEGRATPGEDRNFEWGESIDEAVAALADAKKGGILVYVWSKGDDAAPVQNHLLMDPEVRHYGAQLRAVKLEMGPEAEALGVKETPALAVLDRAGSVKKVLPAKTKPRALAQALRAQAPDKRPPPG